MANKDEFDFEEVKRELQTAVNEYLSEDDKAKIRKDAEAGEISEDTGNAGDVESAENAKNAEGNASAETAEDAKASDNAEKVRSSENKETNSKTEGASDSAVKKEADEVTEASDKEKAEDGTESGSGTENVKGGESVENVGKSGSEEKTGEADGTTESAVKKEADEATGSSDKEKAEDGVVSDNEGEAEAGDESEEDEDYEDEEPDELEEAITAMKKRKTKKKVVITLVLLVVLAAVAFGAYAYMARYFETHFFSGSTINGIDVSGETAAQVKSHIQSDIEKYSLTIHEAGDETEVLSASDIGLSYEDDNSVEKLLEEQDNRNWPKAFFKADKTYTLSAGTTYDTAKVKEAVSKLECLTSSTIVEPQDAEIAKGEDGRYSITPEVEGNEVDETKLEEAVIEAIDAGETEIDIVKNDCYKHPSVYSDDANLNERMETWNSYLDVNVTYVFGDNTETVDGTMVLPHLTDDGTNITLATDWIKTLVYDWGQKYDTFGLARTFTTHDGVTINIPAGGDYGWCINKDETIADVTACIQNGTTGQREPIWLFKAMGWDNGDVTGTYVEVDLAAQHLWLYKDGTCILDTDVVTGAPTAERETKVGIYAIDAKKSPATLGSLDVQGYAEPVSYWCPFNGGQGLHDAPWRSSFGGSIYKSNGSHGCVNIPEDKMQTIYDTVSIGTAVIVYSDKTPATTTTATTTTTAAGETTTQTAGTAS